MAYIANTKAYERPGESITLVPSIDMSQNLYKFVTVNAATGMVVSPAGGVATGVLQVPGIAGEPCRVMTSGVSYILAGGTFAAGDLLESTADGKAVKQGTTPSGIPNGQALVNAVAGDVACILIK